jgi:DNA helicase II / ATP-dependent DNA helicase PcrA
VVFVQAHLSGVAPGPGGVHLSPAEVIPFPIPGGDQPHDAPPEVVAAMGGRIPTEQQWEAISHPLTPCAVIAGAGSGKTAVMAARVAYLVLARTRRLDAGHDGAMPSEILCLTFTNKAAEELSRRVRGAVEPLALPEGEEPTVLTYHAFAARLVDDYGLRMGVEPGRELLSEAQRWQLLRSLLDDIRFEHFEVRSDYIVGEALKLSDQLANHLVDPPAVAEASRTLAEEIEPKSMEDRKERTTLLKRAELAELIGAYQRRKAELGAIDYGDQISHAVRLVRDHPDVVAAFRERYPVVLLDEYQDTNVAQAELLRRLCGEGYPVFAVGDPDQNIYAWRGASLQNILRFSQDFGGEDGGEERPLYVNFRSGSRILAVADTVIGKVPPERRAAGKHLRPHADRGEGRVEVFVASDARTEGRRIAGMIEAEAENRRTELGEPAWEDFAILCRKRRLFGPIAEELRAREIPAEVVDLGGLLLMPEVVDVVSWLRVLEDPGRNIHLARLLMGPRWRIGYRDLVALARWSARHNRALQEVLAEEDDMPGDVSFALAEALDHVDDEEMDGLSEAGRERLREFRVVLAGLRSAASGSLGDLVGEIAERSGLLRELEASSLPSAIGARRNLLNLIQHVSSFSPVHGEASLSTLISYLDTAEETEDDLEPAQPSDANTVKLLTIHKAKGLEWPVVFVPGLAEHPTRWNSSLFPDISRQPNPLTQASTLPFELRGDREVLPQYQGDLKAFRAELRERGEEEERRLCYVALTRAKDVLVTSAAYWYEGPSEPHQPGRFLKEIAGSDVTDQLASDDCPEQSPLIEFRRERARRWPFPAREDDADELFPEGWHGAAIEAVEDPSSVEWRALQSLDAGELAEYRRAVAADTERAELIDDRTHTERAPSPPTTLSVTGLLDYVRCPKLFFWSQVRPLPRKPNPSARLGSDVHRWIELQSRGQATLLDVDELPDLSPEEHLGAPGKAASLREAFRGSRFADKVPLFTERPFLLYVDGYVVGGRIDAVFGVPEGPWEVVDYKTGRVPPEDGPLFGLQLDLYALACIDVWGMRPEDLTLTYFFLAENVIRSKPAGDPEATRARVKEALAGIVGGRFDPIPGDYCRWCDFLSFCSAGKRFMDRAGGGKDLSS